MALIFLILFFSQAMEVRAENISLPLPQIQKGLTHTIQSRQSKRQFLNKPLTIDQITSLLWAAGGKKVDAITAASRTIPSAGATFPLEIFLVVGKNGAEGIPSGLYHYSVDNHSLESISKEDKRKALAQVCLGQDFIVQAPVSVVICADYSRTTGRYGSRGVRYVHIEVGHSCQNAYLMATDLGLATVEVGAFNDAQLKRLLGLDESLEPLAVLPFGYSDASPD